MGSIPQSLHLFRSAQRQVPLLPWPRAAFGPVTAHRLSRLLAGYLLVVAIGAGLLHAPRLADGWHIFGLGLMLPGAGFLAHADLCTTGGIGHTALALGAFALFGLSVLIWFATGNIVAPPLAWVGTALWAAAMDHGPISPWVVDLAHAAAGVSVLAPMLAWPAWMAFARWQRRQDNAYLRQIQPRVHEIFTAPTTPASTVTPPEMSLSHLQRVRFALERALQPVADFEGFEHRDPFQTAALRYQVNFLGYGLALTQARFTPAFRGYMTRAQEQLLHKQRQHRIWSYWALESLWGHLRCNPDPIQRDNIMFTGFVALQMALFEASTGSREASRPGFFTLQHPQGSRYVHDHASLVWQLDASYWQSPFGLVPCEPNWIYPLCNAMSACAVLAHDAQRGSAVWHGRHAAGFIQHLEAEFLDAFGRLVPCRSSATGLALPAIGGAMAQAMPCYFLNALAPDLARRQWLLLRRDLLDAKGRFRRRAFWPIDTGNYGFSRASAYTATALVACELGDQAVYDHCMAALESECPSTPKDGVIHRAQASVWSHGVELMALAGGRDAFRTLINHPPRHPGPWLDEVRYPDVLVASAHADDAGGLHAVLYGAIEGGTHSVVVAGLHPCALYKVEGATASHIVAGRQGRAKLRVRLVGRTSLRLELAWQVRA
ncbi:MAG TPA: hypothetical protein PKV17_06650 [Aquabacterium sp.]|nr:hypothetical protein [Aquabacterium sp.]HRH28442.1 hypothetical protein [Aquabacterium sp.]